MLRHPPPKAGDLGLIAGSGRSPGEGNGNSLQYFAWRIPWTEESGGLQSMDLQRLGHNLATKQVYHGALLESLKNDA